MAPRPQLPGTVLAHLDGWPSLTRSCDMCAGSPLTTPAGVLSGPHGILESESPARTSGSVTPDIDEERDPQGSKVKVTCPE